MGIKEVYWLMVRGPAELIAICRRWESTTLAGSSAQTVAAWSGFLSQQGLSYT